MANPIDTDRDTPKEQRAVTHLLPGKFRCRHVKSFPLISTVPALLNESLPPCGPILQVAYANVNSAIRSQWFQHEGQKSLEEITLAVHQDLIKQKWSREALVPWRSIDVLQYGIRWARSFIRESQNPDALTESEILEQREDSYIPKELGLVCNKQYVLDLWKAWHREKRTIPQPLQETARPSKSNTNIWSIFG